MVEGMIWIPLDGKLSLIYIGARTFAQQRLRSGFYSVLPALRISRFKIHQLDYRSIFSRIVCVSSFIDRTGQSSRVYATKSRRTKDRRRSERKIWARSGRRDLGASLKVEHHRFARGQPARTRRNTIGVAQGRRRTIDRRRR